MMSEESKVLKQAPAPTSANSWQKAYEEKKKQRLTGAAPLNFSVPVTAGSPAGGDVEESDDVGESDDGKELSSAEGMSGSNLVPGVVQVERKPPSAAEHVMPLSNSQKKKLEELEMKNNSVHKLIKKVKLDKGKQPDDWKSEYEARKAKALSNMELGASVANVGSLGAFHTGVHGEQESASTCQKGPDTSSLLASSDMAQKESVPTDVASVVSPKQTPLDIKLEMSQSPGIGMDSVSAPENRDLVAYETPETQKPPVEENPSGNSNVGDESKKKVSMQTLFKQVKNDSKKSIQDWKSEYESKKRKRIEEDAERRSKQVFTQKMNQIQNQPQMVQNSPSQNHVEVVQSNFKPPNNCNQQSSPVGQAFGFNSRQNQPFNSKTTNERNHFGGSRGQRGGSNYGNNSYQTRGNYTNTNRGSYSQNQGAHFQNQGNYSQNQATYSQNRGGDSTNRGGYSQNQASYSQNQTGYSTNRGGYSTNRGGYSQNQAGYSQNQTGYSQNQGGYSQNQTGYSTNRGGYSQNQAGYSQNQAGYSQNQTGYSQNQGGYSQNQGGYSQNRGGYSQNQGGHSQNQGGYSQNRGGYSQNQGGHSQNRGGCSQNRGGYSQNQGGHSQNQGGYSQNRGGYSQNQGGYSQNRGGYSQNQGGYSQNQGGYSQNRGGYSPNRGNYANNQGNYSQNQGYNQGFRGNSNPRVFRGSSGPISRGRSRPGGMRGGRNY